MARKQILDSNYQPTQNKDGVVIFIGPQWKHGAGAAWHTDCAPWYWEFHRDEFVQQPADELNAYGACTGCHLPLKFAVRWVWHNGATYVRDTPASEVRPGQYWHWLGRGFIGHQVLSVTVRDDGSVYIDAEGISGASKATDLLVISNDTYAG